MANLVPVGLYMGQPPDVELHDQPNLHIIIERLPKKIEWILILDPKKVLKNDYINL